MRENVYILLLMLVMVPIAGELKFHPFNDDFRVSFGTTAFFFFLLWIRKIPSALNGMMAGIVVVLFRIGLDWLFADGFDISASYRLHLPAFFFYLTYGLMFSLLRINQYHHRPLLVGLMGTGAEIAANMMELALRSPVLDTVVTLPVMGQIAAIALIRSFFVLSFFNMIQLRQAKWMEEQQRIRNEHSLMMISNLYEESVQLKKTLQHVEEITRDCYELYRQLKETPAASGTGFAQRALRIAGQVHEIKKDNQRIYAGLSKMISHENATDYMNIHDLIEIIVRSNQKYSRLLGKDVMFVTDISASPTDCHIYTTLSLLNNLVANAVEAIREQGTVSIAVVEDREWIEFRVRDDGEGISVKDKELLFKPGFTTKFDFSGKPSTGIGLSYVKELVESLHGTIAVEENTDGFTTVFIIRMPVSSLVQKG
ncbi:sensor histidine kinase [Brevibacillus sp. H7]|uniref:sensor histidine kinase n=1 Tax=Brevibacillus sp. H7 TaxID=3349138 RepID=UPI0037F4FC17